MLFTLRVSIPDRPGMLGEMATAFGKGNANILSLDVIDREDGFAVDDICVEAPDGMQEALRTAAEAVPGLVVEEVRPAGAFRDILAPMELAAVLSETEPSEIIVGLIEHLPDALWATWAAAIKGTPDAPEVIASSVGCPSLTELQTPWLPIATPRRLGKGQWMPARWRMGMVATHKSQSTLEIAAAPLFGLYSAVIVGRRSGPRFRGAELRQLGQLARIASAAAGPELPTELTDASAV